MSSGAIGLDVYTRTRSAVKSLTVVQLKSVLREENMMVSGTKNVLQDRVEKYLGQIYSKNDITGFNRLDLLIRQPNSGAANHHALPTPMTFSSRPQSTSAYGLPTSWANLANGTVQLNFKESPFYEHKASISSIQILKAVDATRATHEFKATVPPEWSTKLDRHSPDRKDYKILLMGASDPVSTFMKLDVAFPHQFEVKINNMDVRSNWKGLKNKPGSTRPADVTEVVRPANGYENNVAVTYALTTKRFYLRLDLVKEISLDSLVRKLQDGKSISKDQVLRDMRNKAKDSDIVATSTVMSLKCPLSYMRLKYPCRGSQCNHNQCFDAMSYLQLQQQAPTWICPICNRSATFDNLQLDQYVADIVKSVPEDIEKVTITPEGEWSQLKESDSNQGRRGVKSEDYSDDDENEAIEILDTTNGPNGRTSLSRPLQLHSTDASRTSSLAPPPSANGSARTPSNKRSHDVVDLTLDSDDEDGPPAAKRQPSSQFAPLAQLAFGQPSHPVPVNGHRPSLPSISSAFGSSRSLSTVPPARPYNSSSMDGYR